MGRLRHHVIARAHMAQDRAGYRRHARANGDRTFGPFQRRDMGLDLRDIWRAVPRIEALRMPARRNLGAQLRGRQDIGRTLVDRRTDRRAADRHIHLGMLQHRIDPSLVLAHRLALLRTFVAVKGMRTFVPSFRKNEHHDIP